jgi:hypothetical protein
LLLPQVSAPHMICMYPPPHMTCMYPPPLLLCHSLLLPQVNDPHFSGVSAGDKALATL